MFSITYTVTRQATTIPFYFETSAGAPGVASRTALKIIMPGYVSTLITTPDAGITLQTVDTWETEQDRTNFYNTLLVQSWWTSYAESTTAYNTANNIVISQS